MVVRKSGHPLGSPDPVGKKRPDSPELLRLLQLIFGCCKPTHKPVQIARRALNGVEYRPEHGRGGIRRRPKYEFLDELRNRRLCLVIALASSRAPVMAPSVVLVPPCGEL